MLTSFSWNKLLAVLYHHKYHSHVFNHQIFFFEKKAARVTPRKAKKSPKKRTPKKKTPKKKTTPKKKNTPKKKKSPKKKTPAKKRTPVKKAKK